MCALSISASLGRCRAAAVGLTGEDMLTVARSCQTLLQRGRTPLHSPLPSSSHVSVGVLRAVVRLSPRSVVASLCLAMHFLVTWKAGNMSVVVRPLSAPLTVHHQPGALESRSVFLTALPISLVEPGAALRLGSGCAGHRERWLAAGHCHNSFISGSSGVGWSLHADHLQRALLHDTVTVAVSKPGQCTFLSSAHLPCA